MYEFEHKQKHVYISFVSFVTYKHSGVQENTVNVYLDFTQCFFKQFIYLFCRCAKCTDSVFKFNTAEETGEVFPLQGFSVSFCPRTLEQADRSLLLQGLIPGRTLKDRVA